MPRYSDPYAKDLKEFNRLAEKLHREHGDVTLDAEYSSMIQDNQLSLLVRLARYKFACKLLSPDDEVLEVGCSTGLGTIFLGQHCKSVLGVEVRAGDVERARALNRRRNVSFQAVDFFDLPPARRFDAVVSLDAVEHMGAAHGKRFVEKMARHLRPDGLAIIGTPNWYIREYQNAFSKASHIKMYTREELVALVERYFRRALCFSMNDEVVHTGHPKTAWYFIAVGILPKGS